LNSCVAASVVWLEVLEPLAVLVASVWPLPESALVHSASVTWPLLPPSALIRSLLNVFAIEEMSLELEAAPPTNGGGP
jgi:hypothetical protein